ncbi:MAG: hypothetical protein WC244_00185 [Patescibacteria group bacterium]|jgi:hypothetical protein
MACLIAPATVAVITTVVRKKIPAKYHIEWLNTMLWGGVIMLIIDHVISGEIVFYPPFLTAMRSPADTIVMLKEIATTGVAMTIAIFLSWTVMILIANRTEKLKLKKSI